MNLSPTEKYMNTVYTLFIRKPNSFEGYTKI